jgi:ribulose-phosphate 3-epimerase
LDLETPLENYADDLYLMADLVLLLGVKAGKGGQEFNPSVLEKIKKMKNVLGDSAKIGIDGGVNEKNILSCKQAGANIFYIGSSFWQESDLQKRYNDLVNLSF